MKPENNLKILKELIKNKGDCETVIFDCSVNNCPVKKYCDDFCKNSKWNEEFDNEYVFKWAEIELIKNKLNLL